MDIKTQQKPYIDGFGFGLGFWLAGLIVNFILLPAALCLLALLLPAILFTPTVVALAQRLL